MATVTQMLQKRTRAEIKKGARAADMLRKQTALEMKEGARNSKRIAKRDRDDLRAAKKAGFASVYDHQESTRTTAVLKGHGAKSDRTPFEQPVPDPNVTLPRRVRLASAIAGAYYSTKPKDRLLLRMVEARKQLLAAAELIEELYDV